MKYSVLSPRRLRQLRERAMVFYPRSEPNWKANREYCYESMVAEEEAAARAAIANPDIQEYGFKAKMRSAVGWRVGAWAVNREVPRIAMLMRFKSTNDFAEALTVRFPVLARRYPAWFQFVLLAGGLTAVIGTIFYYFAR